MNSELIETIKHLPDECEYIAVTPEVRPYLTNSITIFTSGDFKQLVNGLVERLQNCIDAIETLPQDVFGVGGDGETHWYIRDELIERAKEVLR